MRGKLQIVKRTDEVRNEEESSRGREGSGTDVGGNVRISRKGWRYEEK